MKKNEKRGGSREGAGPKHKQEAWAEGRFANFIKDELAGKLTFAALKHIIRGNSREVRKVFKPYMSRDKIKQAVELLESVAKATNQEMLTACGEVSQLFADTRISQEAHRTVAGVKKVPHGMTLDTQKRDKKLRRVKQRAEQAKGNPPPREVRKEWLEEDVAEMNRLTKEKDPDAPVGEAVVDLDPDLWPVKIGSWPIQPLRQLCRDPKCELSRREHLHCRKCDTPMRFDIGPDPDGPTDEEALGICENCYRQLMRQREAKNGD